MCFHAKAQKSVAIWQYYGIAILRFWNIVCKTPSSAYLVLSSREEKVWVSLASRSENPCSLSPWKILEREAGWVGGIFKMEKLVDHYLFSTFS